MAIFDNSFYQLGNNQHFDTARYRELLESAINEAFSQFDQENILQMEAIEITRHITDGIRELIKQDRRIRELVLNKGLIPLATWADMLDSMANYSFKKLRYKIDEMKQELENGRIQGFPGTMFLYNKPTFTTLEGFYKIIFDLADDIEL